VSLQEKNALMRNGLGEFRLLDLGRHGRTLLTSKYVRATGDIGLNSVDIDPGRRYRRVSIEDENVVTRGLIEAIAC
jgi:hypothetical protein